MLLRPSVQLYFGKSGEGKTLLALSHVGPQPVILFDYSRQDRFTKNALICTTKLELVEAMQRGVRRICWRGFMAMPNAEAFEWANRCAVVFGNRVLFWDDVDRYMPVYPVPLYADDIINAGRHRGLTIMASCRRPANMPRNLTAAATAVWSYRITGRRDVAYLADEWFDEEAKTLPEMPRGTCLHWTEAGTGRKKIY
jgi:hypothetical protein